MILLTRIILPATSKHMVGDIQWLLYVTQLVELVAAVVTELFFQKEDFVSQAKYVELQGQIPQEHFVCHSSSSSFGSRWSNGGIASIHHQTAARWTRSAGSTRTSAVHVGHQQLPLSAQPSPAPPARSPSQPSARLLLCFKTTKVYATLKCKPEFKHYPSYNAQTYTVHNFCWYLVNVGKTATGPDILY